MSFKKVTDIFTEAVIDASLVFLKDVKQKRQFSKTNKTKSGNKKPLKKYNKR